MSAAPSRRVAIFLERHGGRKVACTSLTEVEDVERLECASRPLWIVHSEPG